LRTSRRTTVRTQATNRSSSHEIHPFHHSQAVFVCVWWSQTTLRTLSLGETHDRSQHRIHFLFTLHLRVCARRYDKSHSVRPRRNIRQVGTPLLFHDSRPTSNSPYAHCSLVHGFVLVFGRRCSTVSSHTLDEIRMLRRIRRRFAHHCALLTVRRNQHVRCGTEYVLHLKSRSLFHTARMREPRRSSFVCVLCSQRKTRAS